MSPTQTLSARMALRVVARCQALGHDPEQVCRSVGLSLSALRGDDARLDYAAMVRLGERALALCDDPEFGLNLASDVGDTRHYDAGLLAMMASPSVRVALARAVARQRYWGDGERMSLHAIAGGLVLRYRLPLGEGAYARHSDECALAEVTLGVRALSGQPIVPRAVRFRHARPARSEPHERLFGCPIAFAEAATEIAFDDAALDTPLPNANAAFAAIFAEHVERAIARLPSVASTGAHVRSVARVALGAGACDLASTARALGMSARTLQRRLLAEGTTFQALIDALRRELSEEYRARGLTPAEVAGLLGYGDDTAYHHAQRRWSDLPRGPGRGSD